ncbi:hypothetical protein UY3_08978 [Chelonia mydas]|uniref:Uncharacterized protein n=1 Tax=Chelonia mydas TaxID=8469 RepID=M7B9S1_CHEMY|nr:hypothetical protein UY3_08978 [Chelonia mydas]
MAILGPLGGILPACVTGELLRHTPLAVASGASERPEDIIEEHEGGAKEEVTLRTISSSLPDKAIMPSLPFLADVVKRVTDTLQIQLEVVKDSHHCLLGILHSSSSSKIILPINKAILDPGRTIWQIPALVVPTCKQVDKKYYVPAKESEFLFSHPPPNSIVMDTVNSCGHQHQMRSTPYERDWKHLDLFRRKVYSTATLQLRIANYQALMAKYDYINYSKLNDFIEWLLESHREQFKAIIQEDQLEAKTTLQSALNAADTTARSISTVVVV